MKIVIIEDESAAARRLFNLIQSVVPDTELLAGLSSIEESVQWFKKKIPLDLAFFDIQLADGHSFEIFNQVEVPCPVIFTTAYDEYALKAFKVNSIDYLLKPVNKIELKSALDKYKNLRAKADMGALVKMLQAEKPQYKERFAVKLGEHLKTIPINDIAYFYTQDKIQFLVNREGRRFPIDINLDKLEEMLDPRKFFRINRQFVISMDSIADMISYTKARVKVKLIPAVESECLVSSERAADFKRWIAGDTDT